MILVYERVIGWRNVDRRSVDCRSGKLNDGNVDWRGVDRSNVDCRGVDRSNVDCRGVDWSSVDCRCVDRSSVFGQLNMLIERKQIEESFKNDQTVLALCKWCK